MDVVPGASKTLTLANALATLQKRLQGVVGPTGAKLKSMSKEPQIQPLPKTITVTRQDAAGKPVTPAGRRN